MILLLVVVYIFLRMVGLVNVEKIRYPHYVPLRYVSTTNNNTIISHYKKLRYQCPPNF